MEPGSLGNATDENNGYASAAGGMIVGLGDTRAKNTLTQADAWKNAAVGLAGAVGKKKGATNYLSAFGR
jgi:hypothetical protein